MMFKFGGFNMQTNDDYEGYTDEYSNRLDELLGLNKNNTNTIDDNIDSTIANFGNTTLSDNSSIIVSNLEFINEHVNNIRNKANNVLLYSKERHGINSQTNDNMLYFKMNDILKKYFLAQTNLIEKYSNELDFITHVGETYSELDKDLKAKAGDL